MQIASFTVGPFAENTYLLTKEKKALLIDPGFFEDHEFDAFRNALNDADTELLAVVLTHAHVDHVLGLQRVKEAYDVPVYLSDKDHYLWDHFASQAQMFGFNAKEFDFSPKALEVRQDWEEGPFTFDVRYTPGHSPDHLSLYNKEAELVIAGDALFREGIGRTDLYKGDLKTLEESIRKQLYSLPDKTSVYPGHGPKTTIGYEKKNNPFVKG